MNREEAWSFGRLVMRRLGCLQHFHAVLPREKALKPCVYGFCAFDRMAIQSGTAVDQPNNLFFCPDGAVVWHFPDSSTKDRFWFDPQDWYLHYISTIVQRTWRSPIDQVELIVRRLNRCASLPGYFTTQPGLGISYRSSLSLLPLPEEWRLYLYTTLWEVSWLRRYEKLLAQIPADPVACAHLAEKTRYLDRMPGGAAYPCGCAYRQINQDYEMMTNGVF